VRFSSLYETKRILGAGGFGVVAEAICRQTGRHIAVKVTSIENKNIAEREYDMLTSALNHPNIISAYRQRHVFTNFFVMEMELGLETLQKYCSGRAHPLSEIECS
jgi:serine/threonine protein kinase